jgi:acyl carrier protein
LQYKNISIIKILDLDKRFRNFTLKNADKEGKWWFMYGYRPNTNFEGEKILIPYRSSQNNFVVSGEEFYASVDVFYIDIFDKDFSLEYLSCVLSSKFIYHYLLKNCKKKGDIFEFYQEPLKTIPIPQTTQEQQAPFIEKAQTMLTLTKQLNEIVSGFYDYLLAKLATPAKDLNKLKNWYKLDNSGFLELINKIAKTQKISIDDEALLGKFREKISTTNDLQIKISQTDNEIDRMVYALYGLSEEEIEVVENVN